MNGRARLGGGVVGQDAAFLGHYSGEVEAGSVDDGLRQVDGGLAGLYAVESEAGVDVDGHVEANAVGNRGVGQIGNVCGAVDGDADPGLPGKGAEAGDLLRRHDEVRHEYVAEAVGNEDLGLADA